MKIVKVNLVGKENMDYQEQEKSHRLRIIIISIIAVLAVVVIGIGLVFVAINMAKKDQTSSTVETSVPTISETSDRPAVAEPSSTSASSPATESNSTSSTDQYDKPSPSPVAPVPASDDIPSTGPEDLIFSALLIGVAVYLVGLNLQLAKPRHRVV